MGDGVTGVVVTGLSVVVEGFLVLGLLLEEGRETVVGLGVLWVDLDALGVPLDCLGDFVLGLVGDGQVLVSALG